MQLGHSEEYCAHEDRPWQMKPAWRMRRPQFQKVRCDEGHREDTVEYVPVCVCFHLSKCYCLNKKVSDKRQTKNKRADKRNKATILTKKTHHN